ncbi:MAG: nucleoside recognition protein [Desulfobacterales bacterium]|nr:nucleoside recognition protein [Desulfobacterales bacterium]MBS3754879.1 nucleoside recognition protein [Desulfobacterales bacterium]
MNKRGKTAKKYRNLVISLGISALLAGAGMAAVPEMTAAVAWNRLFMPLLRLCLFIGIGLAVAQAIEARGWTRRLGALARPMFAYANLGQRCSAAFSTAFFSGVAANSMLVDFYDEKKITRPQMFLTNFINQLPAYFLHLPTTFFIVVPLTKAAGLIYFGLTFAAVVLRTLAFVIWGHLFFRPDHDGGPEETVARRKSAENPGAWAAVRKNLPARLAGILTYVVPIYVGIYFAAGLGAFEAVRNWMAHAVTLKALPVEAFSVVILSFAAEFTSGFAAAGALMDQGVITVKQTVLALIAGNVIAFPIRAIRHQLPRYMGIFQPKTGLQILVLGQFFRVISLLAVTAVYYILT